MFSLIPSVDAQTTELFNGENLDGWTVFGTEKWYVEDNELICESGSDEQYGYLGTSEYYDDFILELNFKSVNVLENQNIREGIKVYSDWPTIPQLYIKKEFVGGCDIVKEMFEKGELKKLLESKSLLS